MREQARPEFTLADGLALTVYGVLGTPAHALIAWRTLMPLIRRRRSASTRRKRSIRYRLPSRNTKALKVHALTEVHQHIDEFDPTDTMQLDHFVRRAG